MTGVVFEIKIPNIFEKYFVPLLRGQTFCPMFSLYSRHLEIIMLTDYTKNCEYKNIGGKEKHR